MLHLLRVTCACCCIACLAAFELVTSFSCMHSKFLPMLATPAKKGNFVPIQLPSHTCNTSTCFCFQIPTNILNAQLCLKYQHLLRCRMQSQAGRSFGNTTEAPHASTILLSGLAWHPVVEVTLKWTACCCILTIAAGHLHVPNAGCRKPGGSGIGSGACCTY